MAHAIFRASRTSTGGCGGARSAYSERASTRRCALAEVGPNAASTFQRGSSMKCTLSSPVTRCSAVRPRTLCRKRAPRRVGRSRFCVVSLASFMSSTNHEAPRAKIGSAPESACLVELTDPSGIVLLMGFEEKTGRVPELSRCYAAGSDFIHWIACWMSSAPVLTFSLSFKFSRYDSIVLMLRLSCSAICRVAKPLPSS